MCVCVLCVGVCTYRDSNVLRIDTHLHIIPKASTHNGTPGHPLYLHVSSSSSYDIIPKASTQKLIKRLVVWNEKLHRERETE